jgi:ABC-type nitrate/sulfonate/bicarbonate transport system substrate-binding protein
MLEAMASGSVDTGGAGDAPPVFAASGGEPVVIVGARKSLAGDQDAVVVKAYLTTINKAYIWAAANLDKWAAVWAGATGLPLSVMDAAANVNRQTAVAITSAIVSSEQNLVNQFYAAGLIPAKVDISSYITTAFNGTVSALHARSGAQEALAISAE